MGMGVGGEAHWKQAKQPFLGASACAFRASCMPAGAGNKPRGRKWVKEVHRRPTRFVQHKELDLVGGQLARLDEVHHAPCTAHSARAAAVHSRMEPRDVAPQRHARAMQAAARSAATKAQARPPTWRAHNDVHPLLQRPQLRRRVGAAHQQLIAHRRVAQVLAKQRDVVVRLLRQVPAAGRGEERQENEILSSIRSPRSLAGTQAAVRRQ